MQIIQILLILFTLFALSRVFINIKNRTFTDMEGTFWLIFWSLSTIAAIFPQFINYVGNKIGIKTGAEAAVYIALLFLAYLIFRLYAKLDRQNQNITKIIRKIAIENERKTRKNNR